MSIYLGNTVIGNGNYLGSINIPDAGIFMSASVGPNYDPAAAAFITATGVTGTTATAINQLVLDLKSYSLWTKMTAIYPLVGGSSSSTSYNLKDTTTYQISWNGGITFATDGVTGNGTSGYGLTGLNPTTVGIYGSGAHLSQYTRTNGNATGYDMGGNNYPASSPTPEWMIARFNNDRYCAFGDAGPGFPYVIANTANYTGFFVGSTNGTSTIYRNGSSLASAVKAYTIINFDIPILGARGSGGVNDFSSRQYAFYSIGLYLDGTETSNFNTCVTTFQTTLGRNV
jgi:hypothetical protein